MKRKERIESLEQFLKEEQRFEKLYERLKAEIEIELAIDPDLKTNIFLNDLRQTKEKQGASFRNSKKKNKSRELDEFINAFKQDLVYGKFLAEKFPEL